MDPRFRADQAEFVYQIPGRQLVADPTQRTVSLFTGCMTELTASHKLSASHIAYLASQLLGRLATVGADHKPHVVPTSFGYNAELGTVDVGGLHVADTKKYRDVEANGWAAIVIDDLASIDPWTPRFLEIRGRAEALPTGGATLGPGFGDAFIRIYPEKINSYGIA
jgi:pyridoxamine 5'-phosphate oxidase family protein